MMVSVETAELKAAASAHAAKDLALEAKACALVRQYGLLLPRQVKDFMKELADHLNWINLKRML